jgi:cytochrome c-type biogenesis protein
MRRKGVISRRSPLLLVFGFGAAVPLLLLGLLSREAMVRWRQRLSSPSQSLKVGLGLLLVAIGGLVLTGADESIETLLVNASPTWLTDLTTRF